MILCAAYASMKFQMHGQVALVTWVDSTHSIR